MNFEDLTEVADEAYQEEIADEAMSRIDKEKNAMSMLHQLAKESEADLKKHSRAKSVKRILTKRVQPPPKSPSLTPSPTMKGRKRVKCDDHVLFMNKCYNIKGKPLDTQIKKLGEQKINIPKEKLYYCGPYVITQKNVKNKNGTTKTNNICVPQDENRIDDVFRLIRNDIIHSFENHYHSSKTKTDLYLKVKKDCLNAYYGVGSKNFVLTFNRIYELITSGKDKGMIGSYVLRKKSKGRNTTHKSGDPCPKHVWNKTGNRGRCISVEGPAFKKLPDNIRKNLNNNNDLNKVKCPPKIRNFNNRCVNATNKRVSEFSDDNIRRKKLESIQRKRVSNPRRRRNTTNNTRKASSTRNVPVNSRKVSNNTQATRKITVINSEKKAMYKIPEEINKILATNEAKDIKKILLDVHIRKLKEYANKYPNSPDVQKFTQLWIKETNNALKNLKR